MTRSSQNGAWTHQTCYFLIIQTGGHGVTGTERRNTLVIPGLLMWGYVFFFGPGAWGDYLSSGIFLLAKLANSIVSCINPTRTNKGMSGAVLSKPLDRNSIIRTSPRRYDGLVNKSRSNLGSQRNCNSDWRWACENTKCLLAEVP